MASQKVYNLENVSREQWLLFRQEGLGGSDVATAMGINPWTTKYELYLSKVESPKEIEDNDSIYFGRLLEPMILRAFMERSTLEVVEPNEMRFHSKHEFIYANVDGLIVDKDGTPYSIVEAKNISESSYKYWNEGIPTYYYSQLQNYLDVYNFSFGYFAVLVGGNRLEILKVERDKDFCDKMYLDCEEFWTKHVLLGVEPPLEVVDYEKREIDNESSVMADREDFFLYGELGSLKAKIKEQAELLKDVENKIKERMKDSAFLVWQDEILCSWKHTTQERVDTKKLKLEYPEVAEKCLKTTSFRKFLYKTLKDEE